MVEGKSRSFHMPIPTPAEARYHVPVALHPPYRVGPSRPKLTHYAETLLSKFIVPNKRTKYNPVNNQTSWEETY